jgi:diguanylate cyclase (GGDEF)-like protein
VEWQHLVVEHLVIEHLERSGLVRSDLALILNMRAEASMEEATTAQRQPRRQLLTGRSRVVALIGLVTAASLGVWAHNFAAFGTTGTVAQVSLPWPVLAVIFYLSESYVVHLQFRRQAHTLSASEIGLTLGLFFVSPVGLLAAQLLGAGVAIVVNRRQKPIKVWFNLAELSLSSGLGLLVFRSIVAVGEHGVSTWFAALLAAVVAHAVGVLLVTAVIAVAEGLFSASQLGRVLVVSTIGTLSACCLGLLVVELLARDPVALLLLALPVIACGVSFRAYMNQREQRERVEFLYESMRATQGAPEFGLAVGELLVAARRLLRADYAEIFLLSPVAGEDALKSVSGQDGERLMQRVTVGAVDDHAIASIAGSPEPVLLPRRRSSHPLDAFLRSRGLRDAIVCGLAGERRTFGVLVVGDRVGEVTTFAREDVALLETFANHASVLLENGRLERSLAQVTELKEELHHQAYTDALTQLPNRLLFTQRLGETLGDEPTPSRSHAVLFLDLNRFKVVNDSWGHAAGDELLVQVADRIRAAVRPEDTAARLGGDEFAVLVRDTDAAGALRAARRLIDVINAPIALSSGQQAAVHASVGVALTGADAGTPEELLRNADLAMYTAKTEDRAYALFEPVLHHRIRARRSLALELERAAERGEFVSYFQPVVSLVDGTIQAFEALARWEHPERGLLEPLEFLSVAEETGLIFEVGASVRAQALRAASEWQDAHPDAANLGIWVNVAPAELTDERLVHELAVAMTTARIDARRMTVEITESSVVRDEHGALRAMHRLRELGVRLSIDDFGTGYSSLSRLAEFPIELLKIPKPFVDRLIGAQPDPTFVDAILRLAGSLGLVSTSEGVEDISQAQRLRDLGCGLAQGYLFAEPMPAADVSRLLRAAPAGGPLALPSAASFARSYEPTPLS